MKKQTRRCISAFLALLMLFSTLSVAVSALTVGDTVKVSGAKEWISGFYYSFQGSSFGTHKYGQHQNLHTSDGRPAYCVEPNEHFTDGNKTIYEKLDSFSDDLQDKISFTLLYGYDGNTKYGYSWQTEYVATQGIIWALVQGYFNTPQEDAFLNCAFGGKTSAKNRSNCKEVYAKIKAQVLSHLTVPSFTTRDADRAKDKKLTLKYNFSTGKYEGSVTDSKGVLSGYSFSAPGVSFTKSGNVLKVSTDKILKDFTVTGERTSNTYVNSLPAICAGYAVGKDQTTAIAIDLKDPVNAYFSLETESVGNIKIVKISEDGKTEGVRLHISGNGIDKEVRTGKDGTITVENLLAGKYTVTEITDGVYEPQSAQTVTVLPGQTATVTFSNTLKRGSLQVIKTSEDKLNEGVKFHLYGTSYSGLPVDEYAVTNADGIATFENVLIGTGYTLEEFDTAIRYVIPAKQTAAIEWKKVTENTFYNALKKFKVSVTKSDDEKGLPQGDATLSGARYGIYKGEQLIDTYVTDENGQFTTSYYVCGDDWTIREIAPSEGYLLNPKIYHVGAEPKHYTEEYNATATDVVETVKKGNIALIKHCDDGDTGIETPEEGATFEVYLKASGSYKEAKDAEKDILICDKNGFATSKMLPYGVYTVHQTKGWTGKELIDDFDVFVAENGETYHYILNNATFKSLIEIVKKDMETGKIIPAAGVGFKVRNTKTGDFITQHINYPTPMDIDTYYTDNSGKLMLPEELPFGAYEIIEVQTANGYVLDGTPVPFTVDGTQKIVTVEKHNIAQKGKIIITKSGEAFSSVTETDGMYQPVYAVKGLAEAVYEIYAEEDIITLDGTVRAKKGDLVSTVKTDEKGLGESELLYLGKYKVMEKKAPYGMVLNLEPQTVELLYAGQTVEVTSASVAFVNERQKVQIDLAKALEKDDKFGIGNHSEILNIRFGLFAAEEIKAADGKAIPKDGLIEIVTCDESGKATFKTDLPVDAKLYVKEIATDEHYILSDKTYPVEFEYAGQDVATVSIKVNDGQAITNDLIRGNIIGKKVDEDGFSICGAVFGLFAPDETVFTEENAILLTESNEIGVFGFQDVPFGKWIIKELRPAPAFVLNETLYPVVVNHNDEVVEIEIENRFITGDLKVLKVDKDSPHNKLTGAVFEVYVDVDGNGVFDSNIDKLIGELSETDELGVYEMENLRYGGYFLYEKEAPAGYIKDDTYHYFEIAENGQLVEFEIANEQIPVPEIPKTSGRNIPLGIYLLGIGVPLVTVSFVAFANNRKRKDIGIKD